MISKHDKSIKDYIFVFKILILLTSSEVTVERQGVFTNVIHIVLLFSSYKSQLFELLTFSRSIPTMLEAKRLPGVAPEVNLRQCVTCTPLPSANNTAHSGFEPQFYNQFKTEVSVPPQKRTYVLQKLKNNFLQKLPDHPFAENKIS